jgi:hypothetical protein
MARGRLRSLAPRFACADSQEVPHGQANFRQPDRRFVGRRLTCDFRGPLSRV